MSDSRHQSYYEIALTNRQVMGVFVVLLVCVLGAFLAGVWVGRGEAPVVATVEPEAISSGVAEGEAPLEELDFFDRTEPPSARPEPASEPEVVPEDSATPIIIEELSRVEPEVPAETRSATTSPPEVSGEPDPGRSATPGRDDSATEGEFVVQVFSSSDEEQARRVVERLRAGSYPAALSPVDVDGRPMYRVRVGPYVDRDEAQEIADRIRRAYKLDTWITR